MSKKDWEIDGLRNGSPIYLPTNAFTDCPYRDKEGICHIADPVTECDDFGSFFSSWEEWDDAHTDFPDEIDETNYDPYAGQDVYEVDYIDDYE